MEKSGENIPDWLSDIIENQVDIPKSVDSVVQLVPKSYCVPVDSSWYPFPNKEASYYHIFFVLKLYLGFYRQVSINIEHWEPHTPNLAHHDEDYAEISLYFRNIIKHVMCFVLVHFPWVLLLADLFLIWTSPWIRKSHVVPHMNFIPQDPRGKNVHSLFQSFKWIEELSRETWVKMVSRSGIHYYIFEPLNLKSLSNPIVISIFFYEINSRIYSKCIKPQYTTLNGSQSVPNNFFINIPGQIDFNRKALFDILVEDFDLIDSEIITENGDYFCNKCSNKILGLRQKGKLSAIYKSTTLYSDDSGNKSKQWNKHLSYRLALSGLPPQMKNMDYPGALVDR
ncbi:hypothetical protein VP01_2502g2 [Puccinia sorghi]|uniref:Uncharacterized protein n=1 Tax=Puccinia sorghi TaxID=27349 RepID=A0A0L6V697_9BASI|nr:hypothetical protein VP01_2502g2 [Puccinia sorghi]